MLLPRINNNYNQALNLLNAQNQGLQAILGSATNGLNLLSQNRAKQEDELYKQKLFEQMRNPYIINKGTEFERVDPYRTQEGRSIYSIMNQDVNGMTDDRRQTLFGSLLKQHITEAQSKQNEINSNILLNKQTQNQQLLTMLNQTKDVNGDGVVDYNDFTPQEKTALGSNEANIYPSILSKYQNQAIGNANTFGRGQLLRTQNFNDKKRLFDYQIKTKNKLTDENFKKRELLKTEAKNIQLKNQLMQDVSKLSILKEKYNSAKTYEERNKAELQLSSLVNSINNKKSLLDYNKNYHSLLLGRKPEVKNKTIETQSKDKNMKEPINQAIKDSFGFGGQTLNSYLLGNKSNTNSDIDKEQNMQYPFFGVKGTLLPKQREEAKNWVKSKLLEINNSEEPIDKKIVEINKLKKTVGDNVNIDEMINGTDLDTNMKSYKNIVSKINSSDDINVVTKNTLNNLDKYGITFNFSGTMFKTDKNVLNKVKRDISSFPYGMYLFSNVAKQFDRGIMFNRTSFPELQKEIGTYTTEDSIYDNKNKFWSDEIGANVSKFESFKDGIPDDINENTIKTKYKDINDAINVFNNLSNNLGYEYIDALKNRNKEKIKKIENIATKKSLEYYNTLMKHALVDVYKNNGTDIQKEKAVEEAYKYIMDDPEAYGFENQQEAGVFFGLTGSLIGNYIGNK